MASTRHKAEILWTPGKPESVGYSVIGPDGKMKRAENGGPTKLATLWWNGDQIQFTAPLESLSDELAENVRNEAEAAAKIMRELDQPPPAK